MRSTVLFLAVLVAGHASAQSSGCGGLEGDVLAACKREAPQRKAGTRRPMTPDDFKRQTEPPATEGPAESAPFMPTIGMTIEQARATGLMSESCAARMVSRTTTARGTLEQWECAGTYLYFSDGILTGIQE